jgi:DNA polymerase sigma
MISTLLIMVRLKVFTFIGGLSSYGTVLLIVAYMNYFGMRASVDQSPSRLLLGFLDFYGNRFNPNVLGISVYNEGY